MDAQGLVLSLQEENLAVCRLEPSAALPTWAFSGTFTTITRTPEELSIVCPTKAVPIGVRCAKDWRAFKVEGPLDFGLTGILDALTGPLAKAGVSIFAISTFDTDYLLVREAQLPEARQALAEAGHRIQ